VHIEDRYDTGIEDLWTAITDPDRLARWYGEVKGDLRVGGEFYSHVHRQRMGRYLADRGMRAPWGLVITGAEPGGPELVDEITLTADGDQTVLVLEERVCRWSRWPAGGPGTRSTSRTSRCFECTKSGIGKNVVKALGAGAYTGSTTLLTIQACLPT